MTFGHCKQMNEETTFYENLQICFYKAMQHKINHHPIFLNLSAIFITEIWVI